MDLNNIPSNSLKSRAMKAENVKPEKLEPIIKPGSAKAKKTSGLAKAAKSIISEDAQNAKSYIVMDVLVPAIKKAVADVVTSGIDIILYGEAGHSKRGNNAGRVSYRNYYDDKNRGSSMSSTRNEPSYQRGNASLFEDVIVDSRGEAEEILSKMSEYIEEYESISAAEMYDLVGISNYPYTYNNYGWKTVASARINRTSDGFLIHMPPLSPLK